MDPCLSQLSYNCIQRCMITQLRAVLIKHKQNLLLFIIVDIATSYGLESLGSIPDRGRDFSLTHNISIGSGAHTASYSISIEGSLPRI
jgi:hypothetical protein